MSEKPLKIMATATVHEQLKKVIIQLVLVMIHLFRAYPYDMFVFEPAEKGTNIRLAGYHFHTGELNETQIVETIPCKLPETLWLKIDDYGRQFIGTMLFPREY